MAESWWVRNTTSRTLVIGDLSRVPEVPPLGQVDLLVFTDKETINKSANLTTLVNSGMLTINKTSDASNAVDSVEKNEVTNYYTKDEVDALLTQLRDELS